MKPHEHQVDSIKLTMEQYKKTLPMDVRFAELVCNFFRYLERPFKVYLFARMYGASKRKSAKAAFKSLWRKS